MNKLTKKEKPYDEDEDSTLDIHPSGTTDWRKENIDEYDVENVDDIKEFVQFIREYVKQLDRPLDPIPLPVNVNNAGRLALPSVTTTFFPSNGVFN